MIDQEIKRRISALKLSNIGRAMNGRNVFDNSIRSEQDGMSVLGSAVIVEMTNGGIVPDAVLEQIGEEDCLVIKAMSEKHVVLDETACYYLMAQKKAAGVLTDGTLPYTELAAFSKCIGAASSSAAGMTAQTDSILPGNVNVCSGDIIVGNDDGVLVIPFAELDKIMALAEEYEKEDKEKLEKIKQGKAAADIF